jgi:predicted RNA-binding Zn ribbon-like protein
MPGASCSTAWRIREATSWRRCPTSSAGCAAAGLLREDDRLDPKTHRQALALRDALRALLQRAPENRRGPAGPTARLNASAADFPLAVEVSTTGKVSLQPLPGTRAGGLGRVLAELHHAAETGRLDRLKMCAADECGWVFYDRSKPGTRRWCASALCGNRQKTRAYRRRQREAGAR